MTGFTASAMESNAAPRSLRAIVEMLMQGE